MSWDYPKPLSLIIGVGAVQVRLTYLCPSIVVHKQVAWPLKLDCQILPFYGLIL